MKPKIAQKLINRFTKKRSFAFSSYQNNTKGNFTTVANPAKPVIIVPPPSEFGESKATIFSTSDPQDPVIIIPPTPEHPRIESKPELKFGDQKANFGYKEVPSESKQTMVNQVFSSVASNYDVMNDLMSGGMHRLWKNYLIEEIGIMKPEKIYEESGNMSSLRPVKVLDVAAGTGDISYRIIDYQSKYCDNPNKLHEYLNVTLYDPNEAILAEARKKSSDLNISPLVVDFKVGTAENLEGIADNSIDLYVISFGLRNTTSVEKSLQEAHRVLRRGGRFLCMEFSKVENSFLKEAYRLYSFNVIPLMGQLVANDRESYQYLVESIEKFYTQDQLLKKLNDAGFSHTKYENLNFGVVAIHSGFKL